MKLKYFIPVILLLATSCAKVYFVTPQPYNGKIIKAFPSEIQGTYADSTLDISIGKDSFRVNNDTYYLTGEAPDTNQVLVKHYKDFYFACFKEKTYYDVYMGNFYENKLALYMINGDERSINTLKRVVKVDTLNAKEELYLIDPSKKEFNDILDWELFELVSILEKH